MKNKREYAFDILRVIAMIMVIVIHVSNVYSRSYGIISDSSFIVSLFFNTISRISVPIFLMISGALLLDRKFDKKKYLKRLSRFLILIIVWDIIYLVWEYFYLGIIYHNLYKLIFEPYRAHLWFLYTILILYAIQPVLKIILEKANKVCKIILLLIWLSFSTISISNPLIAEYFTIFSYMGFFILGKYLYDFIKNHDLRKYNILFIILILVCVAGSMTFNYHLSHKYNMFYNLYFAYRTPFIMTAAFCFYALIISNYKKDYISKTIDELSKLSLGIYLIHGIFLDITVKTFVYQSIHSIIGIPLFTCDIFICSIISVFIIRKTKYLSKII